MDMPWPTHLDVGTLEHGAFDTELQESLSASALMRAPCGRAAIRAGERGATPAIQLR
jgi:hypothetical protein